MTRFHEELDYMYLLLTRRFGISFDKPALALGDKTLRDYFPPSSLSHLGRPLPPLLYDDEKNLVLISDQALREGQTSRLFGLLHELGHAFQAQRNPDLRYRLLQNLFSHKEKTMQERGVVAVFFQEGQASALAVRTATGSEDSYLSELGERMHEELLGYLSEGRREKEFHLALSAKVYKKEGCPWQEVLLHACKSRLEIVTDHKYLFGYYCASHLTDEELIASTDFPPTVFEHIFYPEQYQTSLRAQIGGKDISISK